MFTHTDGTMRLSAAARRVASCSHVWIDPTEPPIERAPFSPVVGPRRQEMTVGTEYTCRNCGITVRVVQ